MNPVKLTVIGLVSAVAFVAFCMFIFPIYGVWQQTKSGEAELKRAEQNRQIIVQSAQAQKEAAVFKKDAEIIRAEGVAKSLAIVKEQLKDLSDTEARVLILYKWVEGLNDESSQVIYVPTESNMPVLLEAGRIANSPGPGTKAPQIEAEINRDVVSEGSESSEKIRE